MSKLQMWQLEQRRGLPLNIKVKLSEIRIKSFYDYYNGEVYLSCTKDDKGVALLHLIKNIYPDVPVVFFVGPPHEANTEELVDPSYDAIVVKVNGTYREAVREYEDESGRKPIIPSLTSDSKQAEVSYLEEGCNTFGGQAESRPISFWTGKDIEDYLKLSKVTVRSKEQTKNTRQDITYLRSIFLPYSETFTYNEITGVRGYKKAIICLSRLDNFFFDDLDVYLDSNFDRLFSFDYPSIKRKHINLYWKFIDFCGEVAEGTKIIHAQYGLDGIFFLPLKDRLTVPYIVSLRGNDIYAEYTKKKKYYEVLFEKADLFLVRSNSMMDFLIEKGCNKGKIKVHHSGIDLMKFEFKKRKVGSTINFLLVGRLVEKKGIEYAIMSFAKLIKLYKNAKLTIIGGGNLKEDLVSLVRSLSLSKSVFIKSNMPSNEVVEEMYSSHVFVLPSVTAKDGDMEGVPNVLMEAMATGMPVISTFHSGIPELVEDGVTGFLVKEKDVDVLYKMMLYVIENFDSLGIMIQKARKKVESEYDISKQNKKLEGIYGDLIKRYGLEASKRNVSTGKRVESVLGVMNGEKPTYFRADLHLIQGCNSSCIMCDAWKGEIKVNYNREQVSNILNGLKCIGVTEVRFHGNEPTLRNDLISIIAESNRLGFEIGLKTNCLLLDEDYCRKLSDSGLDVLYVSIDSADKSIHDMIRGTKGSFDKIIRAIGFIKQFSNNKIKVSSNTVVMNKNFKGLAKMIDLAKRFEIDSVSFTNLTCRNKGFISDMSLGRAQMEEFWFTVVPEIFAKSIRFSVDVDFSPFFVDLVDQSKERIIHDLKNNSLKYKEEVKDYNSGFYGKKFYERYGCHGPLDHMTIDTEGSVFPCCVMPRKKKLSMGSLNNNTIQEIWNSEKYRSFRARVGSNCKFFSTCGTNFKTRCMVAKGIGYIGDKDLYNKLSYFGYLCNLYHKPKAHLEDLQWNSFKKMIEYAYENIPFYTKKFMGAGIKPENIKTREDIIKIPITTKEEIRKNFPSNLVAKGFSKDLIKFQKTSGSVSEAVPFATQNDHKEYVRMAHSFSMITDFNLGDKFVKFTTFHCSGDRCSSEEEFISNLDPRNPQMILPSSKNIIEDSDDLMEKRVSLLRNYRSKILHADPVYLRCLALYMERKGIKLPFIKSISSTYELLTDSNKSFLERVFNCRVYDQYGCSEVGPIANCCEKGNNHVYSDKVLVEVIGGGKSVGDGQKGRIIVTDLDNFIMPFIRYDTGDVGESLLGGCSCGRNTPLLGAIHGRMKDFVLVNGGVYSPRDIGKVFESISGILFYRLTQKSENEFILEIVKGSDFKEGGVLGLKELLNELFGADVDVEIRLVKSINPGQSGKFSFVRSFSNFRL